MKKKYPYSDRRFLVASHLAILALALTAVVARQTGLWTGQVRQSSQQPSATTSAIVTFQPSCLVVGMPKSLPIGGEAFVSLFDCSGDVVVRDYSDELQELPKKVGSVVYGRGFTLERTDQGFHIVVYVIATPGDQDIRIAAIHGGIFHTVPFSIESSPKTSDEGYCCASDGVSCHIHSPQNFQGTLLSAPSQCKNGTWVPLVASLDPPMQRKNFCDQELCGQQGFCCFAGQSACSTISRPQCEGNGGRFYTSDQRDLCTADAEFNCAPEVHYYCDPGAAAGGKLGVCSRVVRDTNGVLPPPSVRDYDAGENPGYCGKTCGNFYCVDVGATRGCANRPFTVQEPGPCPGDNLVEKDHLLYPPYCPPLSQATSYKVVKPVGIKRGDIVFDDWSFATQQECDTYCKKK